LKLRKLGLLHISEGLQGRISVDGDKTSVVSVKAGLLNLGLNGLNSPHSTVADFPRIPPKSGKRAVSAVDDWDKPFD